MLFETLVITVFATREVLLVSPPTRLDWTEVFFYVYLKTKSATVCPCPGLDFSFIQRFASAWPPTKVDNSLRLSNLDNDLLGS